MLTVAILAGGLATRLHPITETIPKALVEVAGRPFIYRQLDYLRDQGIRRVVICIGYLGAMVEKAVGGGSAFGMEVLYSADGAKLLGTGGAIRQALPLLSEAFFVLYGDSFLPIDFSIVEASFEKSGKTGLMTVMENADRWDKSNVEYSNGKLIEYNKKEPSPQMKYIDYGLGILKARAIADWRNDVFDLSDLYHDLSVRGQLAGHEVHERFYEIGSHGGLNETEAFFCAGGNNDIRGTASEGSFGNHRKA